MEYQEVFNNLKKSINQKGLNPLFSQSIKDLRNYFEQEISTKFLRDLSDLENLRKKTRRINYLIRKCKLKTIRTYRFYNVRGVNPHNVEIVIWGYDKKNLPFNIPSGLNSNEERQLRELREFEEKTGIALFNHAEKSLSDRQKTTHAFNYSGGAVVRDVKVVRVGDYRVVGQNEVLYMIV